MQQSDNRWWVYILKCVDGSLYTGTTNNLAKRVQKHKLGTGAKYTRAHLPLSVVFFEEHCNRSAACKKESQIKKLSRVQKEHIINTHTAEKPLSVLKGFQ